jgi:hypothetical protein
MTRYELVDGLCYIKERADPEPLLREDEYPLFWEVYDALDEAANGEFEGDACRQKVEKALKKATALVPEERRSSQNGWAYWTVRTARWYLGLEGCESKTAKR